MMEEGREDVMEEVKEMRMELRVLREDMTAMKRSLEEIEKLMREELEIKEERKVRRERGVKIERGEEEGSWIVRGGANDW